MSRRAAPKSNRTAAQSAEVILNRRWAAPKAHSTAAQSAEVILNRRSAMAA